jgi:hypothetical protein
LLKPRQNPKISRCWAVLLGFGWKSSDGREGGRRKSTQINPLIQFFGLFWFCFGFVF